MSLQPVIVAALARLVETRAGLTSVARNVALLEEVLGDLGGGAAHETARRILEGDLGLLDALCGRLTVPESFLFRHRGHFEVLRRFAAGRREAGLGCFVLSAGTSRGEEAWSAAAVLTSVYGDDPAARVLGVDLSEHALAVARTGLASRWSSREGVGAYQRWFRSRDGGVEARASLRSRVRFERANLTDAADPLFLRRFDVVFFRNVSIYWRREVGRAVLDRLLAMLPPDGLLLVGPADGVRPPDPLKMEVEGGAPYYRNVPRPEPPSPAPLPSVRDRTAACTAPAPGSLRGRPTSSDETGGSTDRGPKPAEPVVPPSAPGPRLEQVQQLADEGRYAEAEELLGRVEEIAPEDRYLWQGLLALDQGRPREAVRHLRAAGFLQPDRVDVRRWLAVAFREAGALDAAEREERNVARMERS